MWANCSKPVLLLRSPCAVATSPMPTVWISSMDVRYLQKTKVGADLDFFPTEAAGLSWLGEPGSVRVPEVLAVSSSPPALVLEWIPEGRRSVSTEPNLGRGLAELHRAGAPSFGREDRKTTGSRRLPNDPCDTWATFFAERRLRPLARLASAQEALPEVAVRGLEDIADRIETLVGPSESPARLHGDLWGGNRLVDDEGDSWLIDPAAFGGHREFDLAMMRLFGGFDESVFAAYADVFPLAQGWYERIELHQLAPLTVHAIKFGGGYVGATIRSNQPLSLSSSSGKP